MIPSSRPTLVRYPRIFTKSKTSAEAEAVYSLRNQLEHGVAWASGMSGSTNINLHAIHWSNNMKDPSKKTNIDYKGALLGIMMFLVYDGGHSISEVL